MPQTSPSAIVPMRKSPGNCLAPSRRCRNISSNKRGFSSPKSRNTSRFVISCFSHSDGIRVLVQPLRQFLKSPVRQRVQQPLPIRKVPVECHRRYPHRRRQPPHRHRLRASAIQQLSRGCRNLFRSRGLRHVYAVYHIEVYAVYLLAGHSPAPWAIVFPVTVEAATVEPVDSRWKSFPLFR